MLCESCYRRFCKGGTLEWSSRKNKPLAAFARLCTYVGCERPEESRQFYQISEGKTTGGQDWMSLTGSVLCHNCYKRFRDRGTLERSAKAKSTSLLEGTTDTPAREEERPRHRRRTSENGRTNGVAAPARENAEYLEDGTIGHMQRLTTYGKI